MTAVRDRLRYDDDILTAICGSSFPHSSSGSVVFSDPVLRSDLMERFAILFSIGSVNAGPLLCSHAITSQFARTVRRTQLADPV